MAFRATCAPNFSDLCPSSKRIFSLFFFRILPQTLFYIFFRFCFAHCSGFLVPGFFPYFAPYLLPCFVTSFDPDFFKSGLVLFSCWEVRYGSIMLGQKRLV